MVVIWWVARFITLPFTILYIAVSVMLMNHAHEESGYIPFSGDTLLTLIPFLIAVVGSIVGWWREKIGGWMLVAGYLLWIILPIVYYAITGKYGLIIDYMMICAGLPYLIAGVLFLIHGYRKTPKTA